MHLGRRRRDYTTGTAERAAFGAFSHLQEKHLEMASLKGKAGTWESCDGITQPLEAMGNIQVCVDVWFCCRMGTRSGSEPRGQ